jgi:hypothetical protein
MTALAEFLFPVPAERRPGAIFGWWERRRLGYNLIVGSAGLVTVVTASLANVLVFGGDMGFPPWQGIVGFGVLANMCYLLGPLAEIAIQKLGGRETLPAGPVLFRMGLTFSAGLALLPTLIIIIVSIVRVVALVLGFG